MLAENVKYSPPNKEGRASESLVQEGKAYVVVPSICLVKEQD